MLKNKQTLSGYSFWAMVLTLNFCAYSLAERPQVENGGRLGSEQNVQPKQNTGRNPASLHSAPQSIIERNLHPTNPKTTAPASNTSSSHNSGLAFPTRPTRAPSVLESTLSGKVEKWDGNFIPSRDAKAASSKILPLKTKIYIFKGKIKSEGNPTLSFSPQVHKVYAVVNSDENGIFKVQLPPGEYTVFAEIDGKLYRNSFDGVGNFSSTLVVDGQSTEENITDSRNAVF
jgi:hypothetical protein